MGNYVIAGVGNYVIENPSDLGNFMIADMYRVFPCLAVPAKHPVGTSSVGYRFGVPQDGPGVQT